MLLNLEPDHLDRHGTFERYRAAKLRIFERARHRVVPRGLGLEGIEFSADDPLPAEPRLPGRHNRANAAAATAAARAVGIADDAIAEALARVPRRAAPPRARARARRRPLGQRLDRDEHARRARGRRGVRRARAADPRRSRQGRGLRRVRARAARATSQPSTSSARRPTSSPTRSTLPGRSFERAGTIERAVELAAGEAQSRRRRAPVAGVRELRPVRELRAARRGVQEARGEAPLEGGEKA